MHYKITQFLILLTAGALISACSSKGETIEKPQNVAAATETSIGSEQRDLKGLEVLMDYDRDLWTGPDGWNDEQWKWKRRLGWDRECDYVGDVKAVALGNQRQLITVQCIPGAYQPMSYLYLYDNAQEKGKPLRLGLPESSENLQEVYGRINYDTKRKELSILNLSRGVGDCGTYRTFELIDGQSYDKTSFILNEKRERDCEDLSGKDFDNLPKDIFDYENWPISK